MQLTINGEKREVADRVTSIAELLEEFGLGRKILVVELNRSIVERDQYASADIRDGDSVEIVHFVGGG